MSTAQETTMYIAISIVLSFFIYNLTILLVCLVHRIRVNAFQMFFTLKNLFVTNFKINNTAFRVGIIPMNSHVNIHGMVDDKSVTEPLSDTMLISKPKYVQNLVRVLPIAVLTICFAILLFFINGTAGISENFNSALNSLIHFFKTLMGSFSAEEALNKWIEIKGSNNPFILILASIFLSTIISSTLNLLLQVINLSFPDKFTTAVIAFTALWILFYFALLYRVIQTTVNLHGGFDTLLLILCFTLVSLLSAILLFQSFKLLPKHKFV